MWQLRENITVHEAADVVAADGCPLVTADARLAHAADVRCEIRLTAPAS